MKSVLIKLGVVVGLAIGAVALTAMNTAAQDSEPPDEHTVAMREKLEQAQLLLEGIAREDFAVIQHSAEELERLSIDAQWMHIESAEYGDYGVQFRTAVKRTAKMAREKNVEGVTMSFMQVIMSCVQCHQGTPASGEVAMLFPQPAVR